MNELMIFDNPEFGRIRTVMLNGEPWMVGKDVAAALGYGNTKDALASHVDAEDKRIIQRSEIATLDIPNRGMTIINESGLYSLVLSSKLPGAKKFRRWVTSEVLPSIRKTGGYNLPKDYLSALEALVDTEKKRLALEAENEIMKPKALFADSVSASENSILIGDLAKILKQNGIETGQKRLFDWMRNNNYLIKQRGSSYNMPTQRAMDKALFEVKETVITLSDGKSITRSTTCVTGKGQQYFVNLFLNEKKANEGQL